MNNNDLEWARDILTAIAIVVCAALATIVLIVAIADNPSALPHCAEDDVIVGAGEYHADGVWEFYNCASSEGFRYNE